MVGIESAAGRRSGGVLIAGDRLKNLQLVGFVYRFVYRLYLLHNTRVYIKRAWHFVCLFLEQSESTDIVFSRVPPLPRRLKVNERCTYTQRRGGPRTNIFQSSCVE